LYLSKLFVSEWLAKAVVLVLDPVFTGFSLLFRFVVRYYFFDVAHVIDF
jgi:hypothetical protein